MTSTPDLALHARLVAGDPTATLDSIERWLPELIRLLALRFPRAAGEDEHIIATAGIDALLDYTRNPQRYNPQQSSLGHYLFIIAKRDLLNALRPVDRRRESEVPIDAVELFLPDENRYVEDQAISKVDATAVWEGVMAEITDPVDRQILRLLLEGEWSTTAYAKILGIEHLSEREQRAVVKRHKDRISKRLERLGEQLNGQHGQHGQQHG